MEEFDKTIPVRRIPGGESAMDVTMPGQRIRRSEGRFVPGDVIIGRYKVLAELGQGGMGVVYKCFDEIAGVEVALKALPPELSHNTLEMEDIKENFQLVANLAHPNIAMYKQLEKDNINGNYYLIMECCAGEDLRRWIKEKRKNGDLTLEEIISIVRQVAAALDYAHSMKVIHRDIKPGNIMIDNSGNIKVLDFGLAAQIHTSMTRVSMAYHGTSGTGPYMAPEQWRGRAQGAAADQYALAVMTYEMLAGRQPFESSDPAVLQQAVLTQVPEEISGIPKATQDAINRAMSKEAAERFANCQEFVAALGGKRILSGNRHGKIMPWCILAAAVTVVVVGVCLFYLFIRWTPGEKHPKNSDLIADTARGIWKSTKPGYIWDGGIKIVWTPGEKHPENSALIADTTEGKWKSIKSGYAWTEGITIAWTPGEKHLESSDLIADTTEGKWKSIKPGYVWTEGISIAWAPGEKHLESSDLIADTTEGKWKSIKPGYVWTEGIKIEWTPDKKHPENSDLIADTTEGKWKSIKPGYVWTEGISIAWTPGEKHPENSDLIADAAEGKWKSIKPGYVWTEGIKIEWRAGQTSDRYPHWISVEKEGYWRPQEGYREKDPSAEGLGELVWTPGVVSEDGKRKASQKEGNWLYKTVCNHCDGGGTVRTSSDCDACNGSGKVKSTKSCRECDGSGSKTSSGKCFTCEGSGSVIVDCGECGPVYDNFGNVLSYHGQICEDCGGRGMVPYQTRQTNNLGDALLELGTALQAAGQGNMVSCNKCWGNGWFHHSSCNQTGRITNTCSSCSGNGTRSSSSQCYTCDGTGKVKTSRDCSSCSDGKIYKSIECHQCDGNGYVWK